MIDGLSSGTFFKDSVFRNFVSADLPTGQHRNPIDNTAYFTTAYFPPTVRLFSPFHIRVRGSFGEQGRGHND